MKRLLGTWDATGTSKATYRIYIDNDNFSVMYPKSTNDLSFNEAMENWAVILNSPWADHNIEYAITKNAYFKKEFVGCPDYICEYNIIGYGHMIASVFGYGNTPEEALTDCKTTFDYVQGLYNPNRETI